jgi:GMP synthase (glutamine-hydrolysing)
VGGCGLGRKVSRVGRVGESVACAAGRLASGQKLFNTRQVTKPLLVLVTGDPVPEAERQHGSYAEMIQRRVGAAWAGPWQVVDLRHAHELPAPGALAGVIITGSAAYVGDAEAWVLRGLDYMRRLVAAAKPTFGICFGHQMLGVALGGRVARNPNGREIGSVELQVLAPNPLLELGREGGPDEAPRQFAQTTHLDSVVELPKDAVLCARTQLEPHALVQFAPRVWGVQFHPEMDDAIVRHYIDARGDTLEAEGFSVPALIGGLDPGQAGASTLPHFVARVLAD